MSKETRYEFSKEVKDWAKEQAKDFEGDHFLHAHHICPKAIAKKYDLDPEIIRSRENCIAIWALWYEWLHGRSCCSTDVEAGWKGLTEDDYLFLYEVIKDLYERE